MKHFQKSLIFPNKPSWHSLHVPLNVSIPTISPLKYSPKVCPRTNLSDYSSDNSPKCQLSIHKASWLICCCYRRCTVHTFTYLLTYFRACFFFLRAVNTSSCRQKAVAVESGQTRLNTRVSVGPTRSWCGPSANCINTSTRRDVTRPVRTADKLHTGSSYVAEGCGERWVCTGLSWEGIYTGECLRIGGQPGVKPIHEICHS